MVFSTEKSFLEVAPRPLLLDGNSVGVLSVAGACQLKVGQKFILKSNAQVPLLVKVNQFIDELSFYVGAHNKGVNDRVDVSAYLVADGANIFANKQPRPNIPPDDVWRSTYSEEPAMAIRNLLVDECGAIIGKDAPLPITTKYPNNPLDVYIFHELDDGNPTYIGSVNPAGNWIIKELVTSGQDISTKYANISNNNAKTTFSLAWADRVTLTYDLIDNLTII